jgi:amino acid transporter
VTDERIAVKKLSLGQATLIGVAGNAPIYSIAVTSTALVAAVGVGAPIAIFVCALVTLGILLAYARLNEEQPNAGAAYAWVGTILHPVAGFFAGWCVMLSGLLFMISALLPAANATLLLLAPVYVNDKTIVLAVAVLWLVVITSMVARGTALLGRVQSSMTMLEIGLILVIAAGVFAHAEAFDYSVLLAGFSEEHWSAHTIAKGLVVAIFFFWGWDVIFNLAEETTATQRNSSRAGLYALLLLTAIFVFFAAVVAATLPPAELEAGGGNAIFVLADKLLPKPLGIIAVLTFLLSAIGGIEACMVSFSRTAMAKARDKRLWSAFSRLNKTTQTPAFAVIFGSIVVLIMLLLSAAFETVEKMIDASISATGIIVAAYYGMAAIACAVFFKRKREFRLSTLVLYVIWPLLSAAIFFVAALIALTEMDALAVGGVAGGLALGLLVLLAHRDGMHSSRN